MQLYKEMSGISRFLFWLGRGFLKPIFGIFAAGIGIGILYWQYFIIEDHGKTPMNYMLEIKNWFGIIFFNILGIGIFWFGITQIRDTLKTYSHIKLMQHVYDKNGGFFWSNQQY